MTTHRIPATVDLRGEATLHREPDEPADEFTAERWFGVCPHFGTGLFLTRDSDRFLLPEDRDRPWEAMLWPGWEDGERSPGVTSSYRTRHGTFDDARAWLSRVYARRNLA